MTDTLVYAPWQPQAGMAGTYRHLAKAWGDPNTSDHQWPQGVLAIVCERGTPVPLRFDRDCPSNTLYYFSATGIRLL